MLEELQDSVGQMIELPPTAVKVLRGYPPKPVDFSNGKMTLGDMCMQSGETLIAEEDGAWKLKQLQERQEQLNNEVVRQFTQGASILTRRIVPADNSCLFTSIDFVINDGLRVNTKAMKTLRQVISETVINDPETYTEAFLGRSNPEYCAWILDESSWGGGIELSILSRHFAIEIAVVDTQTGRVDRFGEAEKYPYRVFVIYNGIHYDPLVMQRVDGSGAVTTRFATTDDAALLQAMEIGAEAKSSRQFTDVGKFKLRCLVCEKMLQGQKDAAEHGRKTGHTNFGEV